MSFAKFLHGVNNARKSISNFAHGAARSTANLFGNHGRFVYDVSHPLQQLSSVVGAHTGHTNVSNRFNKAVDTIGRVALTAGDISKRSAYYQST